MGQRGRFQSGGVCQHLPCPCQPFHGVGFHLAHPWGNPFAVQGARQPATAPHLHRPGCEAPNEGAQKKVHFPKNKKAPFRVCGSYRPSGRSWLSRAGRPPGCVLVRLNFFVAVWFSFGPLRAACALVFFGFFLLLFFLRAPLVPAFPLFPALGALGLGALWLPARPLFFFCALLSPPFRRFRPKVPLPPNPASSRKFPSVPRHRLPCFCGMSMLCQQ